MACTAAVISGKATSDGRPLLWKHRDTDELDNRLEYFSGAKYSFTGLVNSHGQAAPSLGGDEREVWIGANTAGFSIMNTASYNLNQDDVHLSSMDREGILIYKALGLCRTAADFEFLLDTLPKPLGVEAEFAVIDAEGADREFTVRRSFPGQRCSADLFAGGRVSFAHETDRATFLGLSMAAGTCTMPVCTSSLT